MVIQRLRFYGAICAANLILCTLMIAVGDAADGPNQLTESDFAAGQLVDSLFEPDLPVHSNRKPSQLASRRAAKPRAALRGKLVDNPNIREGSPPFALVNRQGQVLRYVKPVEEINLDAYLGETVAVRRDTGRVLLASQLALPRVSRRSEAEVSAFEEPTPADKAEPILAGEIAEEATGEESVIMPEADSGPTFYDEGYEEGIVEGYGGEEINFGYGTNQGRVGRTSAGRGVMYAHAEYLAWWFEGMNTPPLVIADDNGAFTSPDIIYGGSPILDEVRHGGRLTLGLWLDDSGLWGIEGDYLALGEIDAVFRAGGNDGQPGPSGLFIGRPFFNTAPFTNSFGTLIPRGAAREDVDTQGLDGFVTVTSRSEFQSAGIRLRHSLCFAESCDTGCGDLVGCGSSVNCGSGAGAAWPFGGPMGRLFRLMRYGTRRTDVIYGVRWASLDESLGIREDLLVVDAPTGAASPNGTTFVVNDLFETSNDFVGGEVGFMMEWERRRWSLGFLSKVAIGNTRQRVDISGSTSIDGAAAVDGGLLAQRYVHPGADLIPGNADDFVVGNIGRYERDEFSMIPELGATLGYRITPRLKLTFGYTLLYWSNVLRPGDQIDIDVNGNLIPSVAVVPATVVAGDHPRFDFRQTDLWAQGINLGGEYRW
ncbi:MAG: BBP7 family outer membrane beta-barrel protein [Planctomycetes bacterium]|nr:BBP7 family outer membrane beta-barrel protein [Planctomycetota bacterium]